MTASSDAAQRTPPPSTDSDIQVQSSPGVDSTLDGGPPSVQDPFTGVDPRTGLDPRPATRRSRAKKPAWQQHAPVLITLGLLVIVLELIGFSALGWRWWAVANAILLVAIVALALAWRRRGKGGLLAALAAAWGRRPRLLGGAGRGTGRGAPGSTKSGAPGSRSGRSPLAALRSRLPRFLGGTKTGRGNTPGAVGGRGRGRSQNPRGGTAGKGGPQRRGPLAGLFGRGNRQGAPGSSRGGTAAGRGPGRGSGHSGGKKTPWWRRNNRKGNTEHSTSDHGLDQKIKAADTKQADKGSAKPTPPSTTKPPATPTPTAPQNNAGPRNSAGRPGTGGTMTDPNSGSVAYSDDQSLQAWGANLGGAEGSAAEVAAKYRAAEEAAQRFNNTFGKIRNQGETELPTSNTLMSDIQTIHTRSSNATDSGTWDSISSECGALPSRYRKEHETDEDRINAPRKSLNHEMRADARHAAQDR